MTFKILLFTTLLSVTVGRAQSKKWTLEDCLSYALKNNIAVKQSALDLKLTDLEKKDALGALFPTLNLNGNNAWNTGLTQNVITGTLQTQTTRNSSYAISSVVNLYDGLRNLRRIQRAKLSKIAGQFRLDQMKDDIALFVANAYLQALTAKESLKVVLAQQINTQKQLERTNDLVEAGVLPKGDILEIKATAADEGRRIVLAENAITVALLNLANLLVLEEYASFDIVNQTFEVPLSSVLEKPISVILEKAKANRSEVKIAAQNMELARKDLQLALGAYHPTLNGFFNYNTRESSFGQITSTGLDPINPTRPVGQVATTGDLVVTANPLFVEGNPLPFFDQLSENDGMSYGFQLNIPVFNGFVTRNAVKRSEINIEKASYSLAQTRIDLEAKVHQAYMDAKGAAKAYDAAKISEQAQQQAYQFSKDRYDVGLINSFDFSQSKLRVENSQSELIRAKYDYIFKLKVLELYFGVPISDLKL